MHWITDIDWQSLLVPDKSPVEIFLRGTMVYFALLILLRLVVKRQAGEVGMTDMLVIVLLADASQNAMAGEYKSVPDGILLVSTIIFWNVALEWLGYHFPLVERLISPKALTLVVNGKLLEKHLRHALITKDELLSQLRLEGIEHVSDVKSARLEGDGKISVIPFQRKK